MSDSTKSSMSASEGSDISRSLSETSSTRGCDIFVGFGFFVVGLADWNVWLLRDAGEEVEVELKVLWMSRWAMR